MVRRLYRGRTCTSADMRLVFPVPAYPFIMNISVSEEWKRKLDRRFVKFS